MSTAISVLSWFDDDPYERLNKRQPRTGLLLYGCPASNAIKGGHERNAYGYCHLCGDGPPASEPSDG